MIFIVHMFVFIVAAYECFAALRNPQGQFLKIIVFAALGLIHGVIPAITPRALMWQGASDATILVAAFMALIGIVTFAVGWRLYENSKPQWHGLSPGLLAYVQSRAGQRVLARLFWITMIVSVSAWLLGMVAQAGSVSAVFSASHRFEFRGEGAVYTNVIMEHMTTLLAVPGFLCFFLPKRYLVLGISYSLVMGALMFIASKGARAPAVGMLGCLPVGYVLRYKMSPSRFMGLATAGVVTILVSVALYEVRKVMSESSLSELGTMLLSPDTYEGALTRDPLNYHQFLVAAVDTFPNDHRYVNGATYIRLAIFYLPSRWFPFKPEDTNKVFAQAVTSFASEATIPMTMMGDGYINFWGPPGVAIVMLANGFFFAWVTQKVRENVIWFIAVGGPFMKQMMWALRGMPYEIVTTGLSSLVFAFVLCMICGYRHRLEKRRIEAINNASRMGRNVISVPAAIAYPPQV